MGWSRYLDYKSIIVDRVIDRDRVIQGTAFNATAGIRGAAINFGFRGILQNLPAGVDAVKSLLRIQGDDFAQQCLGASLLYLTNLLGIALSCILASLIVCYIPLNRARKSLFGPGDKMQQQSDNCTYLYRKSKQS